MRFKVFSIMAVLMFAVTSVASAGIFDVSVTGLGDGYWHNESGTAYDYWNGTSNNISAQYQFWGTSDTLSYNTGYMQFGLGSAPSTDEIVSVTLYGYFNSSHLTGSTPDAGSVYHVSNSSGATGDASQKLAGDEFLTIVDPGMSGWNSVDVTDMIINDLLNGYSWSAFSFEPNTTGDYAERYAGFDLASAESGYAAYLRFETSDGGSNAVPEPATMFLFGSGLIGFAVKRRKS